MKKQGTGIDWETVKKRLRQSQQALEKALTASPERTEAVYRERAAQLAGRQGQRDAPEDVRRVLVFALAQERYALDLAEVVELLPFSNWTAVPGAPPQLLGVLNVHGEIRSVVDLARLLEMPPAAAETPGYVVLVRKEGREAALKVDSLEAIQNVPATEMTAAAQGETGLPTSYLIGLTADRLRLLNTDAILAHALFQGASP